MGREPIECNLKVVFMNEPPRVEDIPEHVMRRFCRALTKATIQWLEEKKAAEQAALRKAAAQNTLDALEGRLFKQVDEKISI